MAIFVMLTRIAHERLAAPQQLDELSQQVMGLIRQECPEVKWLQNYAVFGPCDYLDIFEAPDIETATKVSTLIRTYGHANTEIWPAAPWSQFKSMLHNLPREAAVGTGRSSSPEATH